MRPTSALLSTFPVAGLCCALHGRGKLNEAKATFVAPSVCEPKALQFALDGHGGGGRVRKAAFPAPCERVQRCELQDPIGSC